MSFTFCDADQKIMFQIACKKFTILNGWQQNCSKFDHNLRCWSGMASVPRTVISSDEIISKRKTHPDRCMSPSVQQIFLQIPHNLIKIEYIFIIYKTHDFQTQQILKINLPKFKIFFGNPSRWWGWRPAWPEAKMSRTKKSPQKTENYISWRNPQWFWPQVHFCGN